ncbi:hypothetical protein FACS189418_2050 [Clostridia bacterium]|nr:hypothetical protein FACS189418_2050 [Clostridia bacterium]
MSIPKNRKKFSLWIVFVLLMGLVSSTYIQSNASEEPANKPEVRADYTAYIYFDANGGTGSTTKTYTDRRKDPIGPFPVVTHPKGYAFDCWLTNPSGGGTIAQADKPFDSIINNGTNRGVLYAQWKIPQHKVTIKFDGQGATSSPSDVSMLTVDKFKALPTVTRPGYSFDGWWSVSGSTGGSEATTSITPLDLNSSLGNNSTLTLYARWTSLNHQVTVKFDGQGVASPSNVNMITTDKFSALPTVTRPGYSFDGWWTVASSTGGSQATTNVTPLDLNSSLSDNSTLILYARWSSLNHKVTIKFDGQGSASPPNDMSMITTDKFSTLPTVTRSGYVFTGWWTASTGGNEATTTVAPIDLDSSLVDQSILTLYARWEALPDLVVVSPKEIQLGDIFDAMDGVSASDVDDGDLTSQISVSGTVDTTIVGIYSLTYSVQNAKGYQATKEVVVVVNDGSYVIDQNYILQAKSFIKPLSVVDVQESTLLADSTAKAWKIEDTGTVEIPVKIFDDGAYTQTIGVYSIVLAIDENDTVQKTITATVVPDEGKIIEDAEYFIYAEDALINSKIAENVDNDQVKTLTKVQAINKATGVAADVEIKGGSHGILTNPATYPITFIISLKPSLELTIDVVVNNRNQPSISLPFPSVELSVGDVFDPTNGVSASDVEDGDLTNKVTVSGMVNTAAIGIYELTYSVTDSDYNTVSETMVVVVNDGTYVMSHPYILQAESFFKKESMVKTNDGDILSDSNSKAWKIESTSTQEIPAKILATGGYTATEGTYAIVIAVDEEQSVSKTIQAIVVSDNGTVVEDSEYAIYAEDALINTTTADTLDNTQVISLTKLKAIHKGTGLEVSAEIKRGTHGVLPIIGTYPITFFVSQKPSLEVRAAIQVNNRNAPVLVLPTGPIELNIGDSFSDLAGVSATDIEDGDLTNKIIVNGTVNTQVVGIYEVAYSVTDSDYNTVSQTQVIVINDGTYIIDKNYILQAESFVKKEADVKTNEAAILSDAKAKAWRVETTGKIEIPVIVTSDGGYTNTQGSYSISIATSENSGANKTVLAIVISDKGTVVEDAEYILYAEDIQINTTVASGIDDGQIKTLTKVKAIKKATGTEVATDIKGSHGILPTQGDYPITFVVTIKPSLEVSVTVTVNNGNLPTLTIPKNPVVVNKGDSFNERTGISASDPEDGDLTGKITITGTVDTSVVGIYDLIYSVTDSDFNTVSQTVVVIVNDRTYVVDGNYILQAESFFKKESDVSTNDTDILSAAKAKAWKVDNTGKVEKPIRVDNKGGYSNAEGTYSISLMVTENTSTSKTIKAVVVSDSGNLVEDAEYVIYAEDVQINTTTASSLDNDQVKTLTKAKAIQKATGTAADVEIKGGAHGILPTEANYPVSFVVVPKPSVEVSVVVFVNNRNIPTLILPPSPSVVKLGDNFDDRAGVSATDTEDGDLTNKITVSGTVNTQVTGIYELIYSVTDSDHNTVSKTLIVVVNDGTYVVDNAYILQAESFIKKESDVKTNVSDVLSATKAQAWKVDSTGKNEIPTTLSDDGGYTNVAGSYSISIAIAENTSVSKAITAIVISDQGTIVEDVEYILFAENAQINTTEASKLDDTQVKILTKVKAIKKATGNEVNVDLKGSHNVLPTEGTYPVSFVLSAKTSLEITVDILVSNGDKPGLTLSSNPTVLQVGESFDPMSNVSASDTEDGDLTANITISGTVNISVAGIYDLIYSVTDSDYNTVSKTLVVVVNDGTYVIGKDYVLQAESFFKKESDVKTSEVDILADAKAKAWKIDDSGRNEKPVNVTNAGGYANTQGTYSITFSVAEELSVSKIIQAIVVSDKGTVIDTDPEYILYAEDIQINTTVASSIDDAQVKTLTKVKAIKKATGTEVATDIKGAHGILPTIGTYPITFVVTQKTSVQVSVSVLVSNGNAPTLTISSNPIVLHVGDTFNALSGISATDSEDGDLTAKIMVNGTVNTSVVEIYDLVYSVTDSDYNTISQNVVAIVNNGTYIIDGNYILRAESFFKKESDVKTDQTDILSDTKAKAWKIESTTRVEKPVHVIDNGGYTAKQGTYSITISVSENTNVSKTISAIVVSDHGHWVEDAEYILYAEDVLINTTVAKSLTNEQVKTLTNAKSIQKATGSEVTVDILGNAHGVLPIAGLYPVKFVISTKPSLEVSATVEVNDRNTPVLVIPTNPVIIKVGNPFDPMSGVSATDVEDGDLTGKITVSGTVNTAVAGIYELIYSVTDSDHNTVTQTLIVVVDDGSYVLAYPYLLQAESFFKKESAVKGEDVEILSATKAKAWKLSPTDKAEIPVSVIDRGGYSSAQGVYSITVAVAESPTVTKTIQAIVVSDNGHLVEESEYAIYAEDAQINTATANSIDNAQIQSLTKVKAIHKATGAEAVVALKGSHGVLGVVGKYPISFVVVPKPSVQVNVQITVSNGNPPKLTFSSNPVILEVGDLFDDREGIIAIDIEDGDITDKITVNGQVNTSKVGIYEIVYSITDSDTNTVSQTLVVVVNDGTYFIEESYIFHAESFVKKSSDVRVSETDIILNAKAKAWKVSNSGTKLMTISVLDNGGYSATQGFYPITIAITEKISVAKTIKGVVISDFSNIAEDDEYILFANNILISILDAQNLDNAKVKNLSKATAISKRTGEEVPVEIVGMHGVLPKEGSYPVTFAISEKDSLTITTQITVKDLHISLEANDSIIPHEEVRQLTEKSVKERANLRVALDLSTRNSRSLALPGVDDVKVNTFEFNNILNAKENGGIYPLTFTLEAQGKTVTKATKITIKAANNSNTGQGGNGNSGQSNYPKTGDKSNIVLYTITFFLSFGVIFMLLKKRKHYDEHHKD